VAGQALLGDALCCRILIEAPVDAGGHPAVQGPQRAGEPQGVGQRRHGRRAKAGGRPMSTLPTPGMKLDFRLIRTLLLLPGQGLRFCAFWGPFGSLAWGCITR